MHAPDKKQQFIQLRAEGKTLGAIATTLQVSKTTLWRWDQEEDEHIRQLQLMVQEEADQAWHAHRMERLAELQDCSSLIHDAMVREINSGSKAFPLKTCSSTRTSCGRKWNTTE